MEADARVVGIREGAIATDQTCFYPGGGGQPSDEGTVTFEGGAVAPVSGAHADADGVIWHDLAVPPPSDAVGQAVRLAVNRERREVLARYHTVLHVLNTVALRDYSAWITGVQIGVDYSRIDFKWEGFSAALSAEVEAKVNAVLAADHRLRAYSLAEEEFASRPGLLRTLEVKPPVIGGRVRVVEIEGFDAQACGGTHVASTGEIGRFSIFRVENKGRINKRLYVRLSAAG